jgi:uncharacterized protein YhaN
VRGALSRFEFEQLYCLGIEELHTNRLLDEDQELSIRLNALSTMGSFASRLRELERQLDLEATSIYRPDRRGNPRLRELERRLRELDREHRTRMTSIGQFSRVEREIADTTNRIAALRAALRELRDREQLLRSIDLYRTMRTSPESVTHYLGSLVGDPPYDLGTLERVSTLAEELTSELRESDELLGRIRSADRRLGEIDDQLIADDSFQQLQLLVGNAAIDTKVQALAEADREYQRALDHAQLVRRDPFVADEEVGQISREVLSLRTRGALEDSIDHLERLVERAEEVQRDRDEAIERLARDEARLARLREETDLSMAEQANRLGELEDRIRDRASAGGGDAQGTPGWNVLVGILGIAALLGGIVLGSSALSTSALVLLGVGGVLLVAAWGAGVVARRFPRRTPGSQERATSNDDPKRDSDEAEAATLRESLARHLGGHSTAGPIDRTVLRRLIDEARMSREALDRAVANVEESRRACHVSEDVLQGVLDDRARAEDGIEAQFVAWQTPSSYQDVGPRRRLSLLHQLVQAEEALAHAAGARDHARRSLDELREEAIALLGAIGHLSAPIAGELASGELVVLLRSLADAQYELRRERQRLSDARTRDEQMRVAQRDTLATKGRLLSELIGEAPADWQAERLARLRKDCQDARDLQARAEERSASLRRHRDELLASMSEEELAVFEAMTPEEFADTLRERAEELERLDAEISELDRTLVGLHVRREESQSVSITEIDSERSSIHAQMLVEGERFLVASTALELLRQARARYERETRPEVLDLASTLFERFTGGRYREIDVVDLNSKPVFMAVRAGGGSLDRVGVDELSRGTQGQLLLALRLAYLDKVIPDEGGMPIILDDVCVDFDLGRTAEVMDGLLAYSETRQVIYLTCHERERHVVSARADARGAQVAVVELLDAPMHQ